MYSHLDLNSRRCIHLRCFQRCRWILVIVTQFSRLGGRTPTVVPYAASAAAPGPSSAAPPAAAAPASASAPVLPS